MIEEKPNPEEREEGRVVYRRTGLAEEEGAPPFEKEKKRPVPLPSEREPVAAMLTPLLIGFTLLVALVLGLGILSVRQLRQVSGDAVELGRHRSDKLSLLLNLQTALTRLNNEARVRDNAKVRGELMPPLALPLGNARGDVNKLADRFERLPLAQTEKGAAFSRDVRAFVEVTKDLERYSLEGFEKFRTIEAELEGFLRDASREQEEIPRQIEVGEERASGRIYTLTLLAVLTGLLVAAGTTWEVQRRSRQLRRSLEELQRERQFSTQMLEGMVSAVAAIDRQDHIRSANAAFFGVFPGATLGASVHEKFTTPEGTKLLAAATAARAKRSTYHGRWKMADGDAERTFDVYSSPLEIDGEDGRILTLVDVTEAAEAEAELRQQESLAAVGQAAAQVAHEIKNPLGSIRLGVAMLRDMAKEKEAITTIDLVERGIEHLNKLTGEVTQFSRRRQLSLSKVDLHELIDASLDLVADKIQEKQTPVEREYGAEAIHAMWDADQLRQVFVNLFANAVDASAEGSPVSVSTERVAGGQGDGRRDGGVTRPSQFARITITDRGRGMDAATRARIFEPFFTTKKRGTGLGLAIAKQIIEQHGGRISVESAPGQGTRFRIDLPLDASGS